MSQAIKNVLNSFAYDKVSAMLEEGRCVTPSLLDQWEDYFMNGLSNKDGWIVCRIDFKVSWKIG